MERGRDPSKRTSRAPLQGGTAAVPPHLPFDSDGVTHYGKPPILVK